MPLLGKSNKHAHEPTAEPMHHSGAQPTSLNNDLEYERSRAPGAGGTGITNPGHTYESGLSGNGAGYDQGMPGRGMGNASATLGTHDSPHYDPYSAAGVGHDTYGTGAGGHSSIPPSHALHAGQANAGESHGAGGKMTGKVEKAIGNMVGSKSLKAKGMQKEQEAQALKVQSAELAEAERLEREAMMRRERAVAHGAHPENSTLGGGSSNFQ